MTKGFLIIVTVFLLSPFFAEITKAEEVDLELVLAMDASGSISNKEYLLQLEGTYAAFRDPAIQAAITSGPTGRIAVTVMLWSDAAFEKVHSGWFVLDSASAADAFAESIRNFQLDQDRQIGFGGGGTGIGAGVEEALKLLRSNPYRGLRKVIDISGDGIETEFWFTKSVLIADARKLANLEGVTVNGLPIITPNFPDLDLYYQEQVITGVGAFVERATDFEDFGRAIRKKLLREISSNIASLPSPSTVNVHPLPRS